MKKKIVSKCPKCESGCLWYKPDGSILCTVCMTKVKEKENNHGDGKTVKAQN
jgi:uncharacterized Zn finger protein (UPF0148 family)